MCYIHVLIQELLQVYVQVHCMRTLQLIVHSLAGGHLGYFQCFIIINNTAKCVSANVSQVRCTMSGISGMYIWTGLKKQQSNLEV